MANFKLKSARGDILNLSGADNFKLINIDSQTAARADVSSIVVGGQDGDIVNSVQAEARSIVLDLRIIKDVENTKRRILEVIKIKQKITLLWSQENRELEISGIVEEIEMPRWSEAVEMQITLHCEQPFWENADYIITQIREAINLHYFTDMPDDMLYFTDEGIPLGEYDIMRTKSFHNDGDVAVGLDIEIVALGTVTNPIIYDASGKYFGCGYGSANRQVTMSVGDVIHISTGKNEKSVTLNGTSILGKVKPQSTWLQLETGDNQYYINSDDESIDNMMFSIKYKQRYI